MGDIAKAVIAVVTTGVYIFLLLNGLWDKHIFFVVVTLIYIGIAYFIYKH